jgi:EAL domain-containing protein (putative c-di-GMP-specific phosphodiesterase class I)
LGHAVQRNELRLEYQPLVRTSDGRVVGVEALLRWDHPDFGLISPAIFIPMAEQSGNIFEIGRWVLEHACVDRHRWESRTGDETLVMAVNVSAHQLMAPRFMATVTNMLSLTDTEPAEVCIEITESAFLQDAKRAASVLSELRAIGVQLALDDFGTGFSSLTYLMNFPVDIVKIDQTFIANLIESRASHAIVAATIDLCHVLGLTVLCEGVETVEQHREVAELSSDLCQGFYFSRPMTADTLDEMATSSKSAWIISA